MCLCEFTMCRPEIDAAVLRAVSKTFEAYTLFGKYVN